MEDRKVPDNGSANELSSLPQRSRLSVMPLAVLLPKLGEISSLPRLAELLEKRLADLQAKKHQMLNDEGEERVRRLNEESMLNQVMQWLAAGSE